MVEKIKLVQGDTKPALIVSLTDEVTGAAIGLNGCTVRMLFRAVGTYTTLAVLDGVLLLGNANADGTLDFASPFNVAGTGGRIQFNWGPTDLDQPADNYEGEIEILYPDGAKQTVFDLLKFKLREDF
jgi:hypothetical protein